mmetsp:Transcript_22610/g.21780  ORF Transcript_22610/g.21780 Transcript_22610/m.21780 type:complete len:86 (-) Transcript_22610:37-294(-)
MLLHILPHKISMSSFKFDWQHLFLKKKKATKKEETKKVAKYSFASEQSFAHKGRKSKPKNYVKIKDTPAKVFSHKNGDQPGTNHN